MIAQTTEDFIRGLAEKAFQEKRHIPHVFKIEYEDGSDGCLPDGFYSVGYDSRGMTIDFPIRHEYGPFETEQEAKDYSEIITSEMLTIN